MAILIGIPILLLGLMLQLAVVSNLRLLGGTADLILVILIAWAIHERGKSAWVWVFIGGLMVSMISAMPGITALLGYLLAIGLVRLLTRRVWQVPILILFIGVVLGTFFQQLFSLAMLFFDGRTLPLQESLSWITLPSILLNVIISLPIYGLLSDLAHIIHPTEVTA